MKNKPSRPGGRRRRRPRRTRLCAEQRVSLGRDEKPRFLYTVFGAHSTCVYYVHTSMASDETSVRYLTVRRILFLRVIKHHSAVAVAPLENDTKHEIKREYFNEITFPNYISDTCVINRFFARVQQSNFRTAFPVFPPVLIGFFFNAVVFTVLRAQETRGNHVYN